MQQSSSQNNSSGTTEDDSTMQAEPSTDLAVRARNSEEQAVKQTETITDGSLTDTSGSQEGDR
jgi:hypothetical protein